MICSKCGASLPDNARFCSECGAAAGQQAGSENAAPPEYTGSVPLNDIQPVRYSSEMPQAVPAVHSVKKKNRLVPGLCIAAGAVVVLGGAGAVVYSCNRPAIDRMILGDAGYAHSVMMNAAADADKAVFNAASQQLLNTAAAAISASVDGSGADVEAGLDDVFGELDYFQQSDPMEQAGRAMQYAADYIFRLTGTDGLSVGLSGGIELEQSAVDELKKQAADEGFPAEFVDKAVEALKDISLTAAGKRSDGALEYSLKLNNCGDSLGEVQLRYEDSGRATLIFPGMSSRGFEFTLPEHTKISGDIPQYDVMKFYTALSEKFEERFRSYEIKCENGTAELGTLKFSGMTVQITLDRGDICDLMQIVIDTAREDAELGNYIKTLAQIDDDELAQAWQDMNEGIARIRSVTSEVGLNLTFYVNGRNETVGGRVTFTGEGDDEAYAAWLSDGLRSEYSLKAEEDVDIAVHVYGTTRNSGMMKLELPASMLGSDEDGTAVFDVKYSNAGVASAFGLPVTVGSYRVTVPESTAQLICYDDISEKIFSGAEYSLDISAHGKEFAYSVAFSSPEYGNVRCGITVSEAAGEVAPVPGSEYRIVDVEDMSEDDMEAILDDISEYYSELSSSNPLLSVYNAIINGRTEPIPFPEEDIIWD